MVLRRQVSICIFLMLMFVMAGCQGGGGPAAPQPDDGQQQSPLPAESLHSAGLLQKGHQLLALVECQIDAEKGTIDVSPMRTAETHLNLIQLIPIYCHPTSECLDFINLVIDEPTATCDLDVVVTHPVPDAYADVFDMRGIGIFKSTLDPGFTGGAIATQIQNRDGFTTAYDVAGIYDAFLNPYVAFNKAQEKRIFEHSTTTSEHVTCKFPSLDPKDAKFLYALDATWSDPLYYNPDDPLTDPNMAEPYRVDIIYVDPVADAFLSEGTAIVKVYDWQANASSAQLECPDLFGGPMDMTEVWSNEGEYLYYVNMVNDEEAGGGEYPVLVRAADEFPTQPDLIDPTVLMELANYRLGSVLVYDSAVNTAPVASATASQLNIAVGGSVHFDASGSTDAEDSAVASFSWDLNGDGEFGDESTDEVDRQYTEIGVYAVNVIVTDNGGLSDVLDLPFVVHVNPSGNTPPVASAFASKTDPLIDEEITLDASASSDLEDVKPISWDWDLDNDSVYDDASGEVIQHSWAAAGTYNVDVLVKDSGGLGDTLDAKLQIQVTATANEPPVAVAEADKYDAIVGEGIVFDGSASYDPEDGDVAQYMWDLNGDGVYSEGFSSVVSYKYWNPGTYDADLKVYDSKGLSDTLDSKLVIHITGEPNQPPVAIATADKTVVYVDEAVHFDGSDSYDPEEGNVATYLWDLNGDGMYFDAFIAEPDWWYDMPGTYFVDLRVCDTPGYCDTLDTPIEIQVLEGSNKPPVAIATADKYTVYEGDTVHFDGSQSTDQEDGHPVSWQWDLDEDGQYDDSPFILASKQYDTEGVYHVDLKVTDSGAAWDTLDEPLTINVFKAGENFPPMADADVNCAFPVVDQTVRFTDSSSDADGEIVKWEWNFDDGDGWQDFTPTQGNMEHAFADEGVYFVDLRVTDDMDTTDQLDAPISIMVSEPDFVPPTEPPSCAGAAIHKLGGAAPLMQSNDSVDARDSAFLANGTFMMVVSGLLYQLQPPSMLLEPPLLTDAGWIKSIDATSGGAVALSGLDNGIVRLYMAVGVVNVTLEPLATVEVGQPVQAVTFDDSDNLWVYTQGEIREYAGTTYEYNPCKVFEVPEVQTLGVVDDMEFSTWNHSIYLAVNDGANGTVVEVDYLGNVADTLTDVLMGPSRYMDIVIDKDLLYSETGACRIEVFGGINQAYVTRLDTDLNILAQATVGYYGIRSATLSMTENTVIVLEDCCLAWIDMFMAPPDWTDIEQ